MFEMNIDFMLHTVMIYCQVCSRSVQRHAKQVKCCSCCLILHLKCITLSTDELNCILNHVCSWMCLSCTQTIFPFNWIEEDEIFSKKVCGRMNCVDINDLFIDEKEIFHVFDVCDDNVDLIRKGVVYHCISTRKYHLLKDMTSTYSMNT